MAPGADAGTGVLAGPAPQHCRAKEHRVQRRVWVACLFVALAAGCGSTVQGVLTSDKERIWVIVDLGQVYRCADSTQGSQPPRPVCVRAPMASASE